MEPSFKYAGLSKATPPPLGTQPAYRNVFQPFGSGVAEGRAAPFRAYPVRAGQLDFELVLGGFQRKIQFFVLLDGKRFDHHFAHHVDLELGRSLAGSGDQVGSANRLGNELPVLR